MNRFKSDTYTTFYNAAKRKIGKYTVTNYSSESESEAESIPRKKSTSIFVRNKTTLEYDSESEQCIQIPEPLQSKSDQSESDGASIVHIALSSNDEGDFDDESSFNIKTDSEDESTNGPSFPQQLRLWVTKYNVTQNATDELLKMLRSNGHPYLPATARTLLLSQSSVETRTVSNMEYYFVGFRAQLTKYIIKAMAAELSIPNEIHISLNIDGLPLYNSSKKSLWPVLGLISNIYPKVVFPVAITCGDKKPDNLDFLNETISEIDSVLTDGLSIDNNSFNVILSCIICDAPARSMVKCTKLYSGYYGCDKCEQRGEYLDRKVTFPISDNVQNRTDATFRAQSNKEHHHGVSPFCMLPIDMINNFPIDYMHQTCLGVMKRLMITWIKGKRQNRFSIHQKDLISDRLIKLQKHIPSLFARKPRSLDDIDYWKASEFRQFLLYTGRIVLKGIMKDELYSHFIILCVAIRILASERLNSSLNQTAKQQLNMFLARSTNLYGTEFMVYNVHCLSHLSSDASEFSCLDNCSAFPFENYLQYLKKKIRSSRRPLIQIVKRIMECDTLQNPYDGFETRSVAPGSSYILDNNSVCKVLKLVETNQNLTECEVFYNTQPGFTEPLDSKTIGIHRVSTHKGHSKMITIDRLTRRAICLPIGNGDFDFIEVLHSE